MASTQVARPKLRLAYLVSHPIQYQAPLLRRLAEEPDIDLTVFFGSDFSIRGYKDEGFGIAVQWDVPLLDGYRYEFLPSLRRAATADVSYANPLSHGIFSRLRGRHGEPPPADLPYDALWVHGYATLNALQGILAANLLGIPVLLRSDSSLSDRVRSGPKLFVKKLAFALLERLIDATLPTGTRNAAYWSHYFGDRVPQFLMPYAVDNAFFQQRSRAAQAGRADLQRELNLDPARPIILFASKLQHRKHCDDLLEAYLQLAPAPSSGGSPEPHPYLLIVGDGEARPALEARAAGHPGVRFCGFRNQSELPRFFDLCTVFVLSARHEPWGLIVNEVMNAARPVIVSDDVGCQPDLVTDGVEGAVYPVRDVPGLAAALRRVLGSPATAAAMGANALARINTCSFEENIRGLRQALAALTGKLTP